MFMPAFSFAKGYKRMVESRGQVSTETFLHKEFTWKVPNIFDLPTKELYRVDSPEFSFAEDTWSLTLTVNGPLRKTPVVIIALQKLHVFPPEDIVYFVCGNITLDGKESLWIGKENGFYTIDDRLSVLLVHVRSKFVNEGDELVSDGVLTVSCHMRLKVMDTADASSQTEVEEASSPLHGSSIREDEIREESPGIKNVQLDYKKLLKNGEESDVCFVVSGKEFRAHRCIIRARSPVFDAMFHHETEERKSGRVVIEDLDPGSFMDFLEHVYTGSVEVLSDENVFGLYTAADKYDAQTLKSECLEYMQRTLSVDTFCDVMTLALRYQEEELMELAIDFFVKNPAKIVVTVKWQIFMRDNFTTVNELLLKAFAPTEKKKQ